MYVVFICDTFLSAYLPQIIGTYSTPEMNDFPFGSVAQPLRAREALSWPQSYPQLTLSRPPASKSEHFPP